jgi:hypothetical protein
MRVFDVPVKGIIRQSIMHQETYMEIDYKTKMRYFCFIMI